MCYEQYCDIHLTLNYGQVLFLRSGITNSEHHAATEYTTCCTQKPWNASPNIVVGGNQFAVHAVSVHLVFCHPKLYSPLLGMSTLLYTRTLFENWEFVCCRWNVFTMLLCWNRAVNSSALKLQTQSQRLASHYNTSSNPPPHHVPKQLNFNSILWNHQLQWISF
jgi:hypothetical protein